ncbi:MAG TPA: hypothetical protein VK464_15135 [Symbiobacteriaceae bacterium]|jgi:hypothetical protein|nr:hypothetical protein [Symbiobacteriaceae bacterium]
MFWLSVSLGWILLGLVGIRWRRVHELLPAMLVGVLYFTFHTVISSAKPFFLLTDTKLLTNHWGIVLIGQVANLPIMAMLYAQGLRPGGHLPWLRTIGFATAGGAVMLVARALGKAIYAPWWHPSFTVFDLMLMFIAVWKAQSYFGAWESPRRLVRNDRFVRPR